MGIWILTKTKEESHIVVPVFFMLLLYINNMPVDFNIKVLNPQEIFPLAPKATFKNMLLIISFTLFMFFFETGIGNWKLKYVTFPIVLVSSLVFYAIFYFTGLKKIKNGEVLNGYVNDIKIDDEWTFFWNGLSSTLSIIGIFLMFYLLNNEWGSGQYATLKISIPVILFLSVLYLKADGVLGLINNHSYIISGEWWKKLYKNKENETDWGKIVYHLFVAVLILLTILQKVSPKSHSIVKYINPYGTLGRDTNHPALAVFVLLIMAYIFRNKKMGFVIFTILIMIWEILYDKSDIVKNNMKKSLLAFFILFLFIDGGISKQMIDDESNKSS